MDFDDLRSSTDEFEDFEEEDEGFFSDVDEQEGETLILGMTAVERMFISIFLFMNVVVIGLALLMATGRMSL
jgi:hypothetical protein